MTSASSYSMDPKYLVRICGIVSAVQASACLLPSMEQASSLSHELKLVPPIKLFPFSPISAQEAEGARPGGHMKIDSSIPPIDPNASSLKDSIQIQAENRQVV